MNWPRSALSQKYRFNLELAHVPDDFAMAPTEPFDRDYMRAPFQLGYEKAHAGQSWTTIGK